MSLVRFNKDTHADQSASLSEAFSGNTSGTLVKTNTPGFQLADLYRQCSQRECIHFLNDGRWSLYDFLKLVVEQGNRPSNVWISTYSMTELSARVIAQLVDRGHIGKLHLLMDYESKIRYPQVDQLLSNVATTFGLTQLHAKVLVIMGEYGCITLIGSANWTRNMRIESGIIDRTTLVAMHHSTWIEKLISQNPNTND